MRSLLFVLFAVALVAFAKAAAPVPCNNPLIRLLSGRAWAFEYRAFAALESSPNDVCPSLSGSESCCDGVVYDALAAGWVKLYAEVVKISVKLDVLQIEVDILLVEIAAVKNEVLNNPNLTAEQKAAVIAFLNAVSNAVSQLVPNIRANFVQCYSAVLKFYAGLLCKACDPTWTDWVHVNGSGNPDSDDFEFHFAAETCTNFQTACSPFFAPFFQFADAVFTAAENLANQIPDNATRDAVLHKLESFEPPCLDHGDCLKFICFRFLIGLDRLEDWAEDSFKNATSGGQGRRSFITDRAISGINRVQRSALGVVRPPRASSPLTAQKYTGTFDPTAQVTQLNTNPNTNSNSGNSLRSFLVDMLL